jgi:hypothetical protein
VGMDRVAAFADVVVVDVDLGLVNLVEDDHPSHDPLVLERRAVASELL